MPWLEPDAFSKDRMQLMYLIHARSEFDAALWAIFDTRSNWRQFTKSSYMYNPGAVVMHGEHHGKLVEFKVEEAHSWHQVGFPRAVLTFKTQRKLAAALKAIVDAIVADAEPSGHETWMALMLRGQQGGHEEALYGQEFAPPAKIEPLGLLKKVRNRLDERLDEFELLQTDFEYMRQCALDFKDKTSLPYQRGKAEVDEWAKTAHAIHWGCVQPLTCWDAVVKEGEHVEATLLAELGPNIAPGDQLTQKADAAMRSFYYMVFQARQFLVLSAGLPMLRSTSIMRDLCLRYNKSGEGPHWDIDPLSNLKDLNPDQQSNRILFIFSKMRDLVKSSDPSGISSWLLRPTNELQGVTYNQNVENWLSDMALLEELHSSWPRHQMICPQDPMTEVDMVLDLAHHNATSKKREQECGKLLRVLCTSPATKDHTNLSWLKKSTGARRNVSKYWQFVREAIADPKSGTGLPSFDTGRLMSFDISSGYLAEVAAERQRIEDDEHHKKMLEAQTQSEQQFVRQPWDIGAGEDRATKKGPKKLESAHGHASMEDSVQKLALDHAPANDDAAADTATALAPQFPVKEDTLRIMAKAFSIQADGTKSVPWIDFVRALMDIGMTAAQGQGSAVVFSNQLGGSIPSTSRIISQWWVPSNSAVSASACTDGSGGGSNHLS